jgi:hypothetical protein
MPARQDAIHPASCKVKSQHVTYPSAVDGFHGLCGVSLTCCHARWKNGIQAAPVFRAQCKIERPVDRGDLFGLVARGVKKSDMPMKPKPMADTVRSLSNVRVFIVTPSDIFGHERCIKH